jgi:cytochrome c biogenesis protein CcmG/thiol:disulfide interchange protein DsbE
MARYLLPLGIFAILASFLYAGLSLNPRDIGSTRLDKVAPTFTLPTVEDPSKTLNQQVFLGKVSLFNAWASWCVSCRQEHPVLMQLAQYTQIPIYGLNYKDNLDDARNVLQKQGNPYLANAFDEKGRIGMDWGVIGTPETFIVDKRGVVRYKHIGPLSPEVLQQKILPLIKQLENS